MKAETEEMPDKTPQTIGKNIYAIMSRAETTELLDIGAKSRLW